MVYYTILLNKLTNFNIEFQHRPNSNKMVRKLPYREKTGYKVYEHNFKISTHNLRITTRPYLGLILFTLYINDINDYLTDCKASLYTDDTALYCTTNTQVKLM